MIFSASTIFAVEDGVYNFDAGMPFPKVLRVI